MSDAAPLAPPSPRPSPLDRRSPDRRLRFREVHHQDVGFFVFTLPVLRAVSGTVLATMALGMLLAAAVYGVSGALSFAPLRVTSAARVHLAVLAALALGGLALRLSLTTYSLEVTVAGSGSTAAFPGADYVDARVRIPAIHVIALLCVIPISYRNNL